MLDIVDNAEVALIKDDFTAVLGNAEAAIPTITDRFKLDEQENDTKTVATPVTKSARFAKEFLADHITELSWEASRQRMIFKPRSREKCLRRTLVLGCPRYCIQDRGAEGRAGKPLVGLHARSWLRREDKRDKPRPGKPGTPDRRHEESGIVVTDDSLDHEAGHDRPPAGRGDLSFSSSMKETAQVI